MLKFYIISCIAAFILMIALEIKGNVNTNVKEFVKKNWGIKKKWHQKILSHIKTILLNIIPIINLIYIGMYLFMLLASDLTIIKLLRQQKLKEDSQKKELERILKDN